MIEALHPVIGRKPPAAAPKQPMNIQVSLSIFIRLFCLIFINIHEFLSLDA